MCARAGIEICSPGKVARGVDLVLIDGDGVATVFPAASQLSSPGKLARRADLHDEGIITALSREGEALSTRVEFRGIVEEPGCVNVALTVDHHSLRVLVRASCHLMHPDVIALGRQLQEEPVDRVGGQRSHPSAGIKVNRAHKITRHHHVPLVIDCDRQAFAMRCFRWQCV
jgi:hypothetical protein